MKLISAWARPTSRLETSGPRPWPKKVDGVGWPSIEFISASERIQRMRPEADDGEIEPKTVSWRAHQGAITRTNSPSDAMADHHGRAAGRDPRQAR